MNRVLSWPHTPIVPGLLDELKAQRQHTAITDKGMVHFDLGLGPVEMKFSNPRQQLPGGTPVYVWWKGGGFVCAPRDEVDAQEQAARDIAERMMQARSLFAAARRERQAQLARHVDIVLPLEATPHSMLF